MARPKGSGKIAKQAKTETTEKRRPGRPKGSGKKVKEAPKQPEQVKATVVVKKEKQTRAPKKEKAPKEKKVQEAPKQPEKAQESMSDMHIMVPESKKRRFNAAVAARFGARKNSEILIEFIDKYIADYEAELRKS
jgi:hypothetical protein